MRIVYLLAASFLVGCVSTFNPTIPGESADLTILVDQSSLGSGAVVLAENFADTSCSISSSGTRIASFSRLRTSTQSNKSTHRIPATAPFIFTFYRFAGAMGLGDCKATYMFTPEPNASYTASFSGTCSISIRQSNDTPIDDLQPVNPPCYK